MPVKIKKKTLPKLEKVSCGLGISVMTAALALTVILLIYVQQAGDSEPAALGIAAFAAYAVTAVLCLIHIIQGLCTFKKLESYAAVFTVMLTGISLFGLLLNVQLMLAMFFSSINYEKPIEKILGGRSLSEFMSTQSGAWNFMICGISVAFAVGVIDIIRLARKK